MSYCGVPASIAQLWPTPPLGDWAVRDMRNTDIPKERSWVEQGYRADTLFDDERNTASQNDPNSWGICAPESAPTAKEKAARGVDQQLDRPYQTYQRVLNHRITSSLGREMVNNWRDAAFNIGGVGYPLDYGFGPGSHADAADPAYNPQIYMRPGLRPLRPAGVTPALANPAKRV